MIVHSHSLVNTFNKTKTTATTTQCVYMKPNLQKIIQQLKQSNIYTRIEIKTAAL